jgi:hypothetical protein
MSLKKITRRKGFSMPAYLERLLDESESESNFPIQVRHNSCDRVRLIAEDLNGAWRNGDKARLQSIRCGIMRALADLK